MPNLSIVMPSRKYWKSEQKKIIRTFGVAGHSLCKKMERIVTCEVEGQILCFERKDRSLVADISRGLVVVVSQDVSSPAVDEIHHPSCLVKCDTVGKGEALVEVEYIKYL